MTFLLIGALVRLGLWAVRDESRARPGDDRPDLVAWSSPIDDEWIEAPLPAAWSPDDVWATVAEIARLQEVAHA